MCCFGWGREATASAAGTGEWLTMPKPRKTLQTEVASHSSTAQNLVKHFSFKQINKILFVFINNNNNNNNINIYQKQFLHDQELKYRGRGCWGEEKVKRPSTASILVCDKEAAGKGMYTLIRVHTNGPTALFTTQ